MNTRAPDGANKYWKELIRSPKGNAVKWPVQLTGSLHRVFSRRKRAFHCGPLTPAGNYHSPGEITSIPMSTCNGFEGWDLTRCQGWPWPSFSWTTMSLQTELFATKTLAMRTTCQQEYRCALCSSSSTKLSSQNVTQCKGKSPAFLSRPHFFKADEYFTK